MRAARALRPGSSRRGRSTALVLAVALLAQVTSWGFGATATLTPVELLVASAAPPDGTTAEPLGPSALASARTQAVAAWQAVGGDVSGVTVTLGDLPGLTLGTTSGSTVVIDRDAGGWGWTAVGGALDLGTAVRHELGHVLGLGHSSGLMGSTLSPGEVRGVAPGLLPEPEAGFRTATAALALEPAPDAVTAAAEAPAPEPPAPSVLEVQEPPLAAQQVVAEQPSAEPAAPTLASQEPVTGGSPTPEAAAQAPAAPQESAAAVHESAAPAGAADVVEAFTGPSAAPVADRAVAPADAGTIASSGASGPAGPADAATGSAAAADAALVVGPPTGAFVGPVALAGSTVQAVADAPAGWTVTGTVLTVVTPDSGGDVVVRVDPSTGALEVVDANGVVHVVPGTITAVAVVGGAGDDRLTVQGAGALPVTLSYDGGAGHDELVGPAQAEVAWTVDGPGSGAVAGVVFSGLEDLTGAAGNRDTFVLGPASIVPGRLEGGDGGYDVLVVEGSYTSLVFEAMGPDNGTVITDGRVIRYAGLEPITVSVPAAVMVITASSAADDLLLTAEGGQWVIRSQNGTIEEHRFAAPATSLTILLGDGDDSLTIGDLGARSTVITVDGGAGADTLVGAETTGTWTVLGVDAGSYAPTDLPTVLFSDVENLVGAPDAEETWSFLPGSGISGSVTDAGRMTVVVDGFLQVTGEYAFSSVTYGADATGVALSGTGGEALAGLVPFGTGIAGDVTSIDLAILTDGSQVWQLASGTFTAPTLVGTGGQLALDEGEHVFTVSLNAPSPGGTALDLSTDGLVVGATTFAYPGAVAQVSVTGVTVSVGDFFYAKGDLTVSLGEGLVVDVKTDGVASSTAVSSAVDALTARDAAATAAFDGSTLTGVRVATLDVLISGASLFAGTNPLGLDLFESPLTSEELAAEGVAGLLVTDADLGLVLARASDQELADLLPLFSAGAATLASATAVGLPDGYGLSAADIAVQLNSAGALTGVDGATAWVDWASSFPDGYELGDLVLDASDPVFGGSAQNAFVDLGGFVSLAGAFSFERGVVMDVEVLVSGTDDDGPRSVTVRTTTIAISGASVFLGAPGTFLAGSEGWDCTDRFADTGAVGLCATNVTLGLVLASRDRHHARAAVVPRPGRDDRARHPDRPARGPGAPSQRRRLRRQPRRPGRRHPRVQRPRGLVGAARRRPRRRGRHPRRRGRRGRHVRGRGLPRPRRLRLPRRLVLLRAGRDPPGAGRRRRRAAGRPHHGDHHPGRDRQCVRLRGNARHVRGGRRGLGLRGPGRGGGGRSVRDRDRPGAGAGQRDERRARAAVLPGPGRDDRGLHPGRAAGRPRAGLPGVDGHGQPRWGRGRQRDVHRARRLVRKSGRHRCRHHRRGRRRPGAHRRQRAAHDRGVPRRTRQLRLRAGRHRDRHPGHRRPDGAAAERLPERSRPGLRRRSALRRLGHHDQDHHRGGVRLRRILAGRVR